MKPTDWTQAFLVAWILVAVAYDLFAGYWWGTDATISAVAYDLGRQHPVIPFAVGVVLGHVFWRLRE